MLSVRYLAVDSHARSQTGQQRSESSLAVWGVVDPNSDIDEFLGEVMRRGGGEAAYRADSCGGCWAFVEKPPKALDLIADCPPDSNIALAGPCRGCAAQAHDPPREQFQQEQEHHAQQMQAEQQQQGERQQQHQQPELRQQVPEQQLSVPLEQYQQQQPSSP